MHTDGQPCSRAAGHSFLGWTSQDKHPIHLNGAIFTLCHILKFVTALAEEVELGALFLNLKEAKIMRLKLRELEHPQPPTPIHFKNAIATGIANGTVERHRSRSMEMRYFYICGLVKHKGVKLSCHTRQ